jgi:hypothetical protein
VRRWTSVLILALLVATHAFAWGPHPEITDAGVSALGKDHPLRVLLGAEIAKLREHCWMADTRRSFLGDHFPDDYLLFPAATKHYDHLCPEVKATYEPYFRRALQALRTETAVNAARWVGSILHFTEDTGSPPHAAEIRGDVHSKMENWVDAKKIRIEGYAPQLLGSDDDAAVAGFLRRMDGLIAFSRERGLRLRKQVEAGERAEVEPVVLESALETSRVVADLLHTLGTLAAAPSKDGATLRGRIRSKAAPGLEKVGAKVMIDGTLYSTLADADGAYELRNLPAGKLRLLILRAGNETAEAEVALEKGGTAVKDIEMSGSGAAGSLLRNGDFRIQWANPKAPDCWYRTKDAWEGEPLPVVAGRKFRLRVEWKDGAKGDVQIRWREGSAPQGGHPLDDAPLAPGEESRVLTVPEKMGFGRVLIHGSGSDLPCAKVVLTQEP